MNAQLSAACPGLKPQADSPSWLKPNWSALASPALADFGYQTGNSLLGVNGQRIDMWHNGVYHLLQNHLQSSSVYVSRIGNTLPMNYYLPYSGSQGWNLQHVVG